MDTNLTKIEIQSNQSRFQSEPSSKRHQNGPKLTKIEFKFNQSKFQSKLPLKDPKLTSKRHQNWPETTHQNQAKMTRNSTNVKNTEANGQQLIGSLGKKIQKLARPSHQSALIEPVKAQEIKATVNELSAQTNNHVTAEQEEAEAQLGFKTIKLQKKKN